MTWGELQSYSAPMEMPTRKKKAEQIVGGLEQPINLHLPKLLGCAAGPELRQHWKCELETWLPRIAAVALKLDDTPIPARVAYHWIYDETFGGREQRNVEMMLRFLARDYPNRKKEINCSDSSQNRLSLFIHRGRPPGRCGTRNGVDTPTFVARRRPVHEQLPQPIARNDPGLDIIDACDRWMAGAAGSPGRRLFRLF
jgi:hypothetical protein